VVKFSPEWVTGPEQGKSSGRIATFSLWTGFFRDGIQGNVDENVFLQYYEKLWNTTNTNELQLEHSLACARCVVSRARLGWVCSSLLGRAAWRYVVPVSFRKVNSGRYDDYCTQGSKRGEVLDCMLVMTVRALARFPTVLFSEGIHVSSVWGCLQFQHLGGVPGDNRARGGPGPDPLRAP